MTKDDGLLEALAGRLGPDAVVSEPSEVLVYKCDASTLRRALPRAVVFPRGTAEVASVVTECARRSPVGR